MGWPDSRQATARGTANGWSVQLSGRGLKDLGEKGFYECWYACRNDSPSHPNRISAGTFDVKPDGSAQVSMWTSS